MRSNRAALLLASLYVVMAGAWILVSGWLVRRIAPDVETYAEFERLKGLAFVLVTGFLTYLAARALYGRVESAATRLLTASDQLVEAERRAMAGLFASALAHDLGNLLSVLRTESVALLRRPDLPEDAHAGIAALDEVGRNLQDLSNRLVAAGREQLRADRVRVDVVSLAEESVRLARLHERLRGCDVHVVAPAPVEGELPPALLRQVFLNLLLNAAQATHGSGHIEIRLARTPDAVVLEVHDDGPGIAPELRAEVFEPYRSLHEGGTGLGLYSVRAVAALLGGEATVSDSPLGGACLRVRLPHRATAAATPA